MRINENEASVGRRLKSSAVASGKRARRRLCRRAERAENRRNELFQPFPLRNDRILRSSFSTSRDRPSRLGGGGRCRPTSPRVAAASERVTGARAALVAAAAPDTPPRSSDRHLRVGRKLHRCYSLHGVVWRRGEISRREACRAPTGFASHVPGVAQDDHLQQGALTGRHGARELSMRGANEGMARALERRRLLAELAGGPIDCSFPPRPRLSSRRRRVKKCRSYLSYSLATRAPHPTRLRRTPRVALRSRTRR